MENENLIEAFKRYLPRRVFEKIMANPERVRVEGERRFVTILFGDLSGFTSLTEKLQDPEKIVEIVNKYFTRMLEIVEKYEGDVDKFLGDAIMVVFGAPVAHKDDPERAIRAGLEMINAIKELGVIKTPKGDVEINMSIGINTGEVVALNMGSDNRMEYTVMGDNVNLSARLEVVAGSGEIIISDRTYKFVKDIFKFEKLEPVKVKGKEKPVQIYKVLGIKEEKKLKRFEIFINRNEEIEKLKSNRDYAFTKEGLKINVWGEFGVGKTSLINEFLKEKGFRVIHISGDRFRKNIPFASFINYLSGYFGKNIPENLREFFEIKEEKDLIKRLKEKFFNYFYEISNVSPVIIYLDDYESIDRTTLTCFEELEIKDRKILIILESENKISGWKEIKLEGFDIKRTEELLRIYNGIPLEKKIIEFVYKKSKGNPFFILNIFQLLRSKKFIKIQKGEFKLLRDLSSFKMPESATGIILDFLDRLPEELYTFVQYSSVIGNRFDRNMLKGIYNISFERMNNLIEKGIENGIFRKIEDNIEFTSPLYQEAAYSTLFKKRRAEIHNRAGTFLEKYLKENLENYSDILGWHFENAGELEKAVDYYFKTERRMRYLSEFHPALEYIKKIENLNKKIKSVEIKTEAVIEKGRIYFNTGDLKLSKECFERVLKSRLDDNKIGDISGYYAALLTRTGDIENAIIYNKKALEHYKKADNKIGEAHININMGGIYLNTGRFKEAMESYKNALDIALKENKLEISASAYFNIAKINDITGNSEEAKKNYNLSLEIWKRLKNRKMEVQTYTNLGAMCVQTGLLEEAELYLNQAVKISDEIGDKELKALSQLNLGIIESSRMNLEKAFDYYNDALNFFKSQGMINEMNICYTNIGEIYEKKCEFEIAIENYNLAIDGAEKTGDRPLVAYILQRLGEIYFISGNIKESISSLKKCIDIAKEIGINDFLIDASRTLSKIYLFCGMENEAEKYLNFDEKTIGNPEVLARFLEAKADLLIEKREFEKAIGTGERLINLSIKINSPQIRLLGLLVKIDSKIHNNKDASSEISDAEEVLKNFDIPLIRLKIMELTGRLLVYMGDFTTAFSTLETGLNEAKNKNIINIQIPFYSSLIEAYKFIKKETKIIELARDARKVIGFIIENLPKDLEESFYKTNDLKTIFESGIKILYENRNLPIAIELLKGIPEPIFMEFTEEIKETSFFEELKKHIT